MPSISSSAKVLVIGGSGYQGAWVIQDLLERGFNVVAVYRNESGAKSGQGIFAKFGSKFSTTVIPDLLADGAFDEAVKDVDGVAHVASPVFFNPQDPQELIGPAVQATLGLLRSAKKNGHNIRRVVVTSSVVALAPLLYLKELTKFTPADWNDISIAKVEELGKKSDPRDQYAASKALAERAAWDFVKNEKVSFDLVTVLPSYIFGPWVHEVKNKESQGSSPKLLSAWIDPSTNSGPGITGNYVDVRDVAAIHSLALLNEEAGGERLIASADFFSTGTTFDVLNNAKPPFPAGSIAKRDPSAAAPVYLSDFDHSRVLEVLPGFKFRSFEETIIDHVRLLEAKGWLN